MSFAAPPDISVITTFFNARETLNAAVESVLDQADESLEVILVDDGSTDGSRQSVKRQSDSRLIWVQKGRLGRAAALNVALSRAGGKYVAVLDADDMAMPGRFVAQRKQLDQDSQLTLVCSSVELMDRHGQATGVLTVAQEHDALVKQLLELNPFAHSSVMYRRQAALAVGGYNERCEKSIDFNFYLDLLNAGGRFASELRPMTRLRSYPDSWGKQDAEALQMRYGILGLVDYRLASLHRPRLLRGVDQDWLRSKQSFDDWFAERHWQQRTEAKKLLNLSWLSLSERNIVAMLRGVFAALSKDLCCLCYRGVGFRYPQDVDQFIGRLDCRSHTHGEA